jgi:ABC-2 type transport system ATP-binding protein
MSAPRRVRHLSLATTDATGSVDATGPSAAAGSTVPDAGTPADRVMAPVQLPDDDEPAVIAADLGVRYHGRWVLSGCSFRVPAGAVVAVVGRNGSGKSTLLRLLAGLTRPDAGALTVLGGPTWPPAAQRPEDVGFVGQDRAMYRGLRVREMLTLGRRLNPRWDHEYAVNRLRDRAIPLDQKVGRLSGGQRTQVALVMALAKRPRLLILDEPLADLDPLARREVMGTVLMELAERNVTVILSSHALADLSRACDHLLLVEGGQVRLADEIESLIARHDIVTGPIELADSIRRRGTAVAVYEGDRQAVLLVSDDRGVRLDPRCSLRKPTIEDVVFAYQGTGPGGL